MDSIKLNVINHSNDRNNAKVVVFQKNVAPGAARNAVAWHVIHAPSPGSQHAFTLPRTMEIRASDSDATAHVHAELGQAYQVTRDASGLVLTLAGKAPDSDEVEVQNELDQGAINVEIFKAGKLLAKKDSVAPSQSAVFKFKPTIHIGVVSSQVEEGELMDPALAGSVCELSLLGVTAADIVITGEGPSDLRFELAPAPSPS